MRAKFAQVARGLALAALCVAIPACGPTSDDGGPVLLTTIPGTVFVLTNGASAAAADQGIINLESRDGITVFRDIGTSPDGSDINASSLISQGGGLFSNLLSFSWVPSIKTIIIPDGGALTPLSVNPTDDQIFFFTNPGNYSGLVSGTGFPVFSLHKDIVLPPAAQSYLGAITNAVYDPTRDHMYVFDRMTGSFYRYIAYSANLPGADIIPNLAFSVNNMANVEDMVLDPVNNVLLVAAQGGAGGNDGSLTVIFLDNIATLVGVGPLSAADFVQIFDANGNGLGGNTLARFEDVTAVAYDRNADRAYVANRGVTGGILRFDNVRATNGDVAPNAVITSLNGIDDFDGLYYSSTGDALYAVSAGTSAVFIVDGVRFKSGILTAKQIFHTTALTTNSTIEGIIVDELP